MKRVALFEFEDFQWFPNRLREYLTNYLYSMHRVLKTEDVIAPILERCMIATGTRKIVDLCSGAGGPIIAVSQSIATKLGGPVDVKLTDLYPNEQSLARYTPGKVPGVEYVATPVNATNVPEELDGIRTMICSFHHMPPPSARSILEDCYRKRQAICIFEISDNSQPWGLGWIAFPIGFVLTLLFTPCVRPLSLGHLFFTYVIPIMPLVIAWDGAASNLRTYTREDLMELLPPSDGNPQGYHWEIETVTKPGVPGKMLYLLGYPKS